MKKFNDAFLRVIHKDLPKNDMISFKRPNILNEMNSKFPIPKDLLSFYVRKIYDSHFKYVNETSMKFVKGLTLNSENNIFDEERFNKYDNLKLLFICLPYDLKIWKDELKIYLSNTDIEDSFNEFDDQPGVSGTYLKGFIIVINSDYLKELKDIEEIVEHEFVHIFDTINGEDNSFSDQILYIVNDKNEFKTYEINLMNRLEKIYGRYLINENLKDSKEQRTKFLNEIFNFSEMNRISYLLNFCRRYDESKLLDMSIEFLYKMTQLKPIEFENFKDDIYNHFNWF